jgi:hypothetical protein
MYGEFLHVHGYALFVEKIEDPLKLTLFGTDAKGEFFWVKVQGEDASFWVFWNYKLGCWQLRV